MSALIIRDLPLESELGSQAMSTIRGGSGAPWVFGWIRPYVNATPGDGGFGGVINVFEINNNYFAQQMNNQFQTIDISNTAPNALINLAADQRSINIKQ
jgi:hypothetical protein